MPAEQPTALCLMAEAAAQLTQRKRSFHEGRFGGERNKMQSAYELAEAAVLQIDDSLTVDEVRGVYEMYLKAVKHLAVVHQRMAKLVAERKEQPDVLSALSYWERAKEYLELPLINTAFIYASAHKVDIADMHGQLILLIAEKNLWLYQCMLNAPGLYSNEDCYIHVEAARRALLAMDMNWLRVQPTREAEYFKLFGRSCYAMAQFPDKADSTILLLDALPHYVKYGDLQQVEQIKACLLFRGYDGDVDSLIATYQVAIECESLDLSEGTHEQSDDESAAVTIVQELKSTDVVAAAAVTMAQGPKPIGAGPQDADVAERVNEVVSLAAVERSEQPVDGVAVAISALVPQPEKPTVDVQSIASSQGAAETPQSTVSSDVFTPGKDPKEAIAQSYQHRWRQLADLLVKLPCTGPGKQLHQDAAALDKAFVMQAGNLDAQKDVLRRMKKMVRLIENAIKQNAGSIDMSMQAKPQPKPVMAATAAGQVRQRAPGQATAAKKKTAKKQGAKTSQPKQAASASPRQSMASQLFARRSLPRLQVPAYVSHSLHRLSQTWRRYMPRHRQEILGLVLFVLLFGPYLAAMRQHAQRRQDEADIFRAQFRVRR